MGHRSDIRATAIKNMDACIRMTNRSSERLSSRRRVLLALKLESP